MKHNHSVDMLIAILLVSGLFYAIFDSSITGLAVQEWPEDSLYELVKVTDHFSAVQFRGEFTGDYLEIFVEDKQHNFVKVYGMYKSGNLNFIYDLSEDTQFMFKMKGILSHTRKRMITEEVKPVILSEQEVKASVPDIFSNVAQEEPEETIDEKIIEGEEEEENSASIVDKKVIARVPDIFEGVEQEERREDNDVADDSLNAKERDSQKIIYVTPTSVVRKLDITSEDDINFTSPTPSNNDLVYDSFYISLSTDDTLDHYSFLEINNDLILWLRMDDHDGSGNLTGLSSYGINGTLLGNAFINSSGKFGNATQFDGDGDYINISQDDTFDFSQNEDFSVSAWVYKKGNNSAGFSGVVSNGAGSNSDIGWTIRVSNNNNLVFYISDGTLREQAICGNTIIENQWMHVAGTWDRDGALIGYINGTECGSNPNISDRNIDLNSVREVSVGRWITNSQGFNGSIDEVLIFNRSLSSSEVLSLYNASANQYENNFTNLLEGETNFTGYAVDIIGNHNLTNRFATFVNSLLATCKNISFPGTYFLLNDIFTTGTCFTINSDNVTISSHGYLIDGDGLGIDYGFYAHGRKNITIKNIVNVSNFYSAISFLGVNDSFVRNLSLVSNVFGIVFNSSRNSTLSNLAINLSNSSGIYLYNSSSITLDSSIVEASNREGICNSTGILLYNSSNNTLINNTISDNTFCVDSGISLESSSYNNWLISNNIFNNAGAEILDLTNSSFINYILYNNSFGEIFWVNPLFWQNITVRGDLTFPGNITILNNSAEVISQAFTTSFINSSTNITFYDLDHWNFFDPEILMDGVNCPTCYNFTPLTVDVVVFNVTRFSNYSIGGFSTCPNSWSGNGTLGYACQVTTCGNLSLSGYYEVQNDVSINGTCFIIQANNITFDLGNYTINATDITNNSYGVYSEGYNLTTIYSGTFNNFIRGVFLNQSYQNNLSNLSFYSVGDFGLSSHLYGIYVNGSNNTYSTIFVDRINNSLGYGYGLYLNAENDTVTDITTQNTYGGFLYGYGLYIDGNNVQVSNSHFSAATGVSNGYGLYIRGDGSTFSNITAFDSSNGIFVTSSDSSLLTNITTFSNGNGVHIDTSGNNGTYSFITSNDTFRVSGTDNIITNTTIDSNYLLIFLGLNNTFINGTIFSSGSNLYGVHIYGSSRDNLVQNFTIFNVSTGIRIQPLISNIPHNNNITGNIIYNVSRGIYVSGSSGTQPENNTIMENTIFNSTSTGIEFSYALYSLLLNNHLYDSPLDILISNSQVHNYSLINSSLQFSTENGSITFIDRINTSGPNLSAITQIGNNSVFINSSLYPTFNISANITLINKGAWSFITPEVKKNGEPCSDCYNFTPLNSAGVSFNVSSFSEYSIGEIVINVTVDPVITFIDPTPENNSAQAENSVYVNVSSIYYLPHYTFVDFNNDLVGWWTFGNNNGTHILGESNYLHNGTIQGNVLTNSSGMFGNTSSFDGVNDYLNFSDQDSLDFGIDSFSISLWVKFSQAASAQGYFISKAYSTAASTPGYLFYHQSDGDVTFMIKDGSTRIWTRDSTAGAFIDDGNWYHLVVVVDGRNNITQYINGTLRSVTYNDGPLSSIGSVESPSSFVIGSRADLTSRFFNGSIDELLIFNRSLNLSEILSLYNASVNQYQRNFSNLSAGEQNFTAHSVGENGNRSFLDRTFTIDVIPPTFISLSNITAGYDTALSSPVNATDNFAVDSYFINDTTNFAINVTTGLLTNNSLLSLTNYSLNVSVNDTSGNVNSSIITVFVTQGTPSLTLSSTLGFSLFVGTDTIITGTGCPAQLNCTLYFNGTNVSNGYNASSFALGSYVFVYNTTGNINYTNASTTQTLTISPANAPSSGGGGGGGGSSRTSETNLEPTTADSEGSSTPFIELPSLSSGGNNDGPDIILETIEKHIKEESPVALKRTEETSITELRVASNTEEKPEIIISKVDTSSTSIFSSGSSSSSSSSSRLYKEPIEKLKSKILTNEVYEIVEIDKGDFKPENIDSAVIRFKVDKQWIFDNSAEVDDVVLQRFSITQWQDLPTYEDFERDGEIHYKSLTPGFSFFAITLKGKPDLESPSALPDGYYQLNGIFLTSSHSPVSRGLPFTFTNLHTNVSVVGTTGSDFNNGFYSVIIPGEIGDPIKVELKGWSDVFLLQGTKEINFVTSLISKWYSFITLELVAWLYALFVIILFALVLRAHHERKIHSRAQHEHSELIDITKKEIKNKNPVLFKTKTIEYEREKERINLEINIIKRRLQRNKWKELNKDKKKATKQYVLRRTRKPFPSKELQNLKKL